MFLGSLLGFGAATTPVPRAEEQRHARVAAALVEEEGGQEETAGELHRRLQLDSRLTQPLRDSGQDTRRQPVDDGARREDRNVPDDAAREVAPGDRELQRVQRDRELLLAAPRGGVALVLSQQREGRSAWAPHPHRRRRRRRHHLLLHDLYHVLDGGGQRGGKCGGRAGGPGGRDWCGAGRDGGCGGGSGRCSGGSGRCGGRSSRQHQRGLCACCSLCSRCHPALSIYTGW
eukprot:gene11599-biopygen4285